MKPKKFGKVEGLKRSPTAKALELSQFKPKVVKNKKREAERARAKSMPDEAEW
jgi:hypothetical protein